MTKTGFITMRFPTELLDRVNNDAKALRRSKTSIVVEIVEKHYEKPNKKKLAGQR
jgi:predicted DNA-binding protein